LLTVRANLAGEIREAIAAAPCTLRALARAAGVSNVALVRIRRGTLLATPTIAVKLAEVLEQWGVACQRAAKRLRRAARRVPTPRTRGKP
jgi:transcriptional regulator with XRE-family HTH domain